MQASLMSFVLALAAPAAAQDPAVRVVVGFHDQADGALIAAEGGELVKAHANGKTLVARVAPGRIAGLRAAAGVAYVEEDVVVSLSQGRPETLGKPAPQPAAQPSQTTPWGVTRIEAPLAATTGAGIIVGVVDTGIDRNHPDLVDNYVGGVNTISTEGTAEDDNGHGTHCAGTIAGVDNVVKPIGVVGVAKSAKIFAAKALNKRGSGWSSDLAEGIAACETAGARVISMSWGSSGESTTIKNAIVAAQGAGILCVAAAGNEGSANPGYPAATTGVLSVGATGLDADGNDVVPWWSNRNPDVSAPGVSVLSTWKGDVYNTISGTSMACPHAAGVAALVRSKNGGLSAVQVEAIIRGSVESKGDTVLYGDGIVNAKRAVEATPTPQP